MAIDKRLIIFRNRQKTFAIAAIMIVLIYTSVLTLSQRQNEMRTVTHFTAATAYYNWVDSRIILITSFVAPGNNLYVRASVPWLYNVGEHSVIKLNGSDFPQSIVFLANWEIPTTAVSPNGRYVLTPILGLTNVLHISDLKLRNKITPIGEIKPEWNGTGTVAWNLGSTDWIWCLSDHHKFLYATGSERRIKSIKSVKTFLSDQDGGLSRVLGFTDPSHALVFSLYIQPTWTITPTLGDLYALQTSNGTVEHINRFSIPDSLSNTWEPKYYTFGVALSPDRSQIAWLAPYQHVDRFSQIKNQFRRWHILGSPPNPAIWISDAHGRHFHRVTEWNCGTNAAGNIQWSPDGKTLTWEEMNFKQEPTKDFYIRQVNL